MITNEITIHQTHNDVQLSTWGIIEVTENYHDSDSYTQIINMLISCVYINVLRTTTLFSKWYIDNSLQIENQIVKDNHHDHQHFSIRVHVLMNNYMIRRRQREFFFGQFTSIFTSEMW